MLRRHRPSLPRGGIDITWVCKCGQRIVANATSVAETYARFEGEGWSREPMTMACLCPACTRRRAENAAALKVAAEKSYQPAGEQPNAAPSSDARQLGFL